MKNLENVKNNRREFIKKGAAGIAGLSVFNSLNASESINSDKKKKRRKDAVITRTLGRTGIEVPVVSMGVMNANLPSLVQKSYEDGARLFDTAWFYQNGMNETMVGEVLKDLKARESSVIVTKIFLKEQERDLSMPETKQLFLDRFEQSLKRLQTDYVDILLYHSSSDSKEHNSPFIIEAFNQLKEAGKVKFTGVSLHGDDTVMVNEMAETGYYDVVLVMFNAALAGNTRLINALQNAADKGMGVIAMKTQCGGNRRHWKERYKDTERENIELNHSALLKWVLQHEFVATAIPGYTNFDQLDENWSVAYNLEYTEEEKTFLEKAEIELASSFCIRCGACKSTCPNNTDVPNLMRTYMYAYQYRNIEHARATEQTIPRSASIRNCISCNECSAHCARLINIAQRISSLKDLNFHIS